ncbi:hypothetical protein ACVWWN_006656 [Mycobacterium sp. URHB0021]
MPPVQYGVDRPPVKDLGDLIDSGTVAADYYMVAILGRDELEDSVANWSYL